MIASIEQGMNQQFLPMSEHASCSKQTTHTIVSYRTKALARPGIAIGPGGGPYSCKRSGFAGWWRRLVRGIKQTRELCPPCAFCSTFSAVVRESDQESRP